MPLGDEYSAVQATAERAVTRMLQGSCQLPLAAYASLAGGEVQVQAMVGTPDGATMLRAESSGPFADAAEVGARAAESLLSQGADDIIQRLLA